MLKTYLVLPIILAVLHAPAVGSAATEDGTAYDVKGLFAVPDAPAFSLVDGTPDEILRPTTVSELNVIASRFSDGDAQFAMPRSISVEFSPGLLLGGKGLTIEKYREHRFLYRMRMSVATRRADNTSSATDIALGLRWTLTDGADLRMNDVYLQDATAISTKMLHLVAPEVGRPGADETSGIVAPTAATSAEYLSLQAKLRRLQERASDTSWNKAATEMAAAILGSSADSTGRELRTAAVAAWLSHAQPLGKAGQLVFGGSIRAQRGDDDVFRGEGSSAVRAYLGTNHYKASLTGQARFKDGDSPLWSLEVGGEAFASKGFWLAFSAGWEYDASMSTSGVISKTSLRYGLPSL